MVPCGVRSRLSMARRLRVHRVTAADMVNEIREVRATHNGDPHAPKSGQSAVKTTLSLQPPATSTRKISNEPMSR